MAALEGVVAVAELAEAAWRMRGRSAEKKANEEARELEAVAAEAALEREQAENVRLRATLEEYDRVLADLQKAMARQGGGLIGEAGGPEEGTADFFRRLQERVRAPDFLEKLRGPPVEGGSELVALGATRFSEQDGYEVSIDVDDPSWWQWVTDKDLYGPPVETSDELDGSGYVVVDGEDVVDAVANFVAHCVSSHPDTKRMSPEQLQEAMANAFKELEKKSRMRYLWEWATFLYTYASWAAAVVSIGKNPLVVRATLIGVWTSMRIIMGVLRKGTVILP